MNSDLFFPIDIVEKNSRVVIYGAGRNSRLLFENNELLNWCEIIMVVDGKWETIKDYPMHVNSPESLLLLENEQYDYILVSVYNYELKKEIRDMLIAGGVSNKKIILTPERFISQEENIIDDISKGDISENRKLKILFYPGGVMGDNIIALKLYQQIEKIAHSCVIDVMTGFTGFPEIIYGKQKSLGKIIHRWIRAEDKNNYDVILQSHFEPSILYYNVPDVTALCPEFAAVLNNLYEYQKKDFFYCNPAQYMNRIQWDRAKFLGKNCYTILDASGAFGIVNSDVIFEVEKDYEDEYKSLSLGDNYITYNYGASDPLRNGKPQTKMWIYEHHCRLNALLKDAFPDIKLVQLGASDVVKIPGADEYVLGRHLEVTKHVLKNSIVHIDCEGGLVHIASQLGTKCVVMFGPTPVGFFGYDNNINIVDGKCKECCGLVPDWYTRCYKYESPICMKSITPEKVFEEIKKILEQASK